ncbi:HlyD family secretion protein, partial [Klebsiella pneumoniae]|nr:HlyD family secretion protein [Klebsiella pneumoniae]
MADKNSNRNLTEMPAMNPTSKKNILVLAALGAAALAAASYGAYWW